MEKSNQSSFLKNLALAFGDGLLFGVAVKLAQGPTKSRHGEMTGLGPLAERVRKVENRIELSQTTGKEGLPRPGESLDGRVLEKVILALEARLTEHMSGVERRLAEMDAQVALELQAAENHAASQVGDLERAIQQVEPTVHDYVEMAQNKSAERISAVDQKLSALQEALPAKFREIVDAVRQAMEARLEVALTELESRVAAQGVAQGQLRDLEAQLRSEMDGLAGRLSTDLQVLTQRQQSQEEPMRQAIDQLEGKLATLREELPPKIRQIVEAVEAAMDTRITAGHEQAATQIASLQNALASLREEAAGPSGAAGVRQALEQDLQRQAGEVRALDQKLTRLQEQLPPSIEAAVDAVRAQLETSFRSETEQLRRELATDPKTASLEQSLAKLQESLAVMETRLGAADRRETDQEASLEQQAGQVSALDQKLTVLQEALPAKLRAIVDAVRESMDARMAAELTGMEQQHRLQIQQLEANSQAELEKARQYASLLETRVQALEQSQQRSSEDTVGEAVERVWQAIESRFRRRAVEGQPTVRETESIAELRHKSTSAEQSVLDLIAGLGELFEGPSRPVTETAPESKREEPAVTETAPESKQEEPAVTETATAEEAKDEPAVAPAPEPAASPLAALPEAEPQEPSPPKQEAEEEFPISLLTRKEPVRKWRIPFVSSFFLVAIAIAWLQFM